MRFAFGIVVGILLTVGAAYVADTQHAASEPNGKGRAQMVNWAVVDTNLHALSARLDDLWASLVGEARQLEKQLRS